MHAGELVHGLPHAGATAASLRACRTGPGMGATRLRRASASLRNAPQRVACAVSARDQRQRSLNAHRARPTSAVVRAHNASSLAGTAGAWPTTRTAAALDAYVSGSRQRDFPEDLQIFRSLLRRP